MAENIYSKGTRVWFEDKEQAWLSAEVTQVTKGPDDSIKLVFVDERGKVGWAMDERERGIFLNQRITGNYHQYHRERYKRWQRGLTTIA